jgi:hypothetical protein
MANYTNTRGVGPESALATPLDGPSGWRGLGSAPRAPGPSARRQQADSA